MFILEELFCSIDDFCLRFEPAWKKQQLNNGYCFRLRDRQLSLSEIMTILISFHVSGYKNFKTYYLNLVSHYWREAFPCAGAHRQLRCRIAVGNWLLTIDL